MAKNIAKLTNATVAETLVQQALSIPQPANYFKGRKMADTHLPDNILLFIRQPDSQLNAPRRRDFHRRHILVLPLRGRGRVIVNAKAFAIGPGCCLYIPPYQFHHYSDVATRELCWLFITFDQIGSDHIQGGIRHPADEETFNADLHQLMRAYLGRQTPASAQQLACRLALLLANVQEPSAVSPRQIKPSRGENLLLRVHALLNANLSQPLSIAEISRKLAMSESSLRSQFRNASGHSLGNFQQTLRLQHAASLLSQSQPPNVAQVASACGWESPYSFSRAFSAYWGRPPKQFARHVADTGTH